MHQSVDGVRAAQLAVEQDAWNAALARARGERILDDPKLLSRCAVATRLPALPMQAAAQLGVSHCQLQAVLGCCRCRRVFCM